MDFAPVAWLVQTLRSHPELAVFFALAIGFAAGSWKVGGFTLGNVTATLLAGVLIGQLGITVGGPIKSTFFLIFLFAVGFGVGPQFFRGLGREGPRQIVFSLIVLALCLIVPVLCAMAAGLDVGYAAGLYAGSQTISAAIGVATDQIDRLGYTAAQAKAYADAVPIGYAVTYIFGTIGSAVVLAQLGPKLIGVDLAAACADYERQLGAGSVGLDAGVFSAYRAIELRAYRITADSGLTGRPVRELFPGLRVFVERVRRGDEVSDADADTVLTAGDVVAISGPHQILVEQIDPVVSEVHDAALLSVPATAIDVFVTKTAISGKTLRELADRGFARGVHLRKISRNMVEIPILPETEVLRGDILTIAGSQRNIDRAAQALGFADRPLESTDLMTVAGGIFLGGLIGAISFQWGRFPISLSTSGGALLAGLILGYLRAIHPTFGRIPTPALVLMNTLGLNVFIAVVGINAGPGFIAGLQQVGLSLFLWGIVATSVPLIIAVLLGHYVFKFHPAILFGVCAGVRTTTAALGMIQEAGKSKVPALGYGMPYAIGNTLLTIFGMIVVLLLSRAG
ncbi:MAG TPA: aspartate-alanine antiporter [Vicinamibacterales bacterium]|nr:aspartate-alanine antiporter [Vicinamibacterales bacterium]